MKFQSNFVGLPNRLKIAFKMFFILLSLLYFIFHTLNGENGMRSYSIIKKQIIEKENLLKDLKKRERNLERNVKLLGNDTLDLDLLEERCRVILNYAFDDDIIINESGIYAP